MRELKFRAWDGEDMDNVGVSYDGRICWEAMHETMCCSNEDIENLAEVLNHEDSKKEIIMQFTGLLDKNGVEIYEGDICEKRSKRGSKKIAAIKWDNETAMFEYGDECAFENEYMEVIGNIYENPELLT